MKERGWEGARKVSCGEKSLESDSGEATGIVNLGSHLTSLGFSFLIFKKEIIIPKLAVYF